MDIDTDLMVKILAVLPDQANRRGFESVVEAVGAEPAAVKRALDQLQALGRVGITYGRGFYRKPEPVTVAWADVRVTDIDSGSVGRSSESRYRISAGEFDAWYVQFGDDTTSADEWLSPEDGTTVEDPTHITLTHVPAEVAAEVRWNLEDDEPITLAAAASAVAEAVNEHYWGPWHERVGAVEDALKAELLPFSPATEEA